MVNFRNKYLNSKFKYMLKQKGNGEATNDIIIFNTIEEFVNYTYTVRNSRSGRMTSFLTKFSEI